MDQKQPAIKPLRVKDILAAHKESQSKPEWDFFKQCEGQQIQLILLNGTVVTGTLVVATTYTIILQERPDKFPVMYFKHALESVQK